MRVLLDECVPRRFKLELPEFDVSTVRDEGWTSQRNGDLLREMVAAGFTVFVTMDRNLMHQQNVSAGDIAVFVLRARTNRLQDLAPLAPKLRSVMLSARIGEVVYVAL